MRLKINLKMAWEGMTKNKKTYLPYLLTCAGMVMMFYIISFLCASSIVGKMPGGRTMQGILQLGQGVIGIFAAIFLFYTNSFLVRGRKKEFGLYNILGMGKKNLGVILFLETVITAVFSLGTGLLSGILFSKISELCLAHVLKAEIVFGFSISFESVQNTVLIFCIIFFLILLNALRQIHLSKPVELLHSEVSGEKPPKANWIAAAAGGLLLAGAYYLAVTIEEPLAATLIFFAAVIMVIVATYLLFMAGSVVLCRILQKNKRYYYKVNHFIPVSFMAYRMKRNGAGLASICILSTMVLVMISSTACLYIGSEDSLRSRYPRNIVVDALTDDQNHAGLVRETIYGVLQERDAEAENILHYRYWGSPAYLTGNLLQFNHKEMNNVQLLSTSEVRQLFIIPLADYNTVMKTDIELEENQALIHTTKGDYPHAAIEIEGVGAIDVKKADAGFVDNGADAMQMVSSIFLFVPDMEKIKNSLLQDVGGTVHDYYGFDLKAEDDAQREISGLIRDRINRLSLEHTGFPPVSVEGAAEEREEFYGLYGGLFFLGILLGLVFICGAVLIMYYKQIIEGYEDQARFEILQKAGMTKKEIKKSINSQILTVFFLPLAAAGIHVAFAFPMISRILLLFNLVNTGLLIAVTACCYMIFAVFYVAVYLMTSRSYYHIISGIKTD